MNNNIFPLTGGFLTPGEIKSYTDSLDSDTKKTVCRAEREYFSGKTADAKKTTLILTKSDDADAITAYMLINALISLAEGDFKNIEHLYRLLKAGSLISGSKEQNEKIKLLRLFFNIVIHNTEDIEFPHYGTDSFAGAGELTPIAVYAYAHYLIICGDYGRAIGMCEGVLVSQSNIPVIQYIYLCLITSVGYIKRLQWDRAEYYFMSAWKKALPDKFFMPFAEHRTLLSGMVEKCLRGSYNAEFKKITALAAEYHKNWVKIHNAATGDRLTDTLSATELNIAMLASGELSNSEIGEFLNISVNSVRAHLRNIFEKLDITSRKELPKYVIK